MGQRGTVTDYAGEPLYVGDLINYATRCGNGTRAADAIIREIEIRRAYGKRIPFLKIQPTGVESRSGLEARKTLREEWIGTDHVRLLRSNVTGQQTG
ncbi:hypothetical protein HOV12_gp28 [Streptomyces phage Lilbooboo]|uniref:Uncharacterized protein n=1 Tax=Streptomyces phage Lilbooboo TaxID=2510571 RepID=A0A411B301_9CAUD|nr:hypothetical protein HOV12_gp28 [Streptomyces phage Lilbooboo]QAX94728.1 hypothetical protein SEA_LILBOOBOO_28 [Streptomyces phage Lilbooboo]